MWALILVTTMLGYDYKFSANSDTKFMPGFATYDLCVEAGNTIPVPKSNNYTTARAEFVCVKMK